MEKKSVIVISILLCASLITHSMQAHGEGVLKETYEDVYKKYIKISSWDVWRRKENYRPITHEFEHDLEDKKIIEKIIDMAKNGTSGISLDACKMQENVSNHFQHKQHELEDNFAWYAQQNVVSYVIMLGSAFTISNYYWQKRKSFHADKSQENTTAAAAVGFMFGLGLRAHSYIMKDYATKTHLDANNKMKETWNIAFTKQKN
jgi:hypothetical protein